MASRRYNLRMRSNATNTLGEGKLGDQDGNNGDGEADAPTRSATVYKTHPQKEGEWSARRRLAASQAQQQAASGMTFQSLPHIDKDAIDSLVKLYRKCVCSDNNIEFTDELNLAWKQLLGMPIRDFCIFSPAGFAAVYELLGESRPLDDDQYPPDEEGYYIDNQHDPQAYRTARQLAIENADKQLLPQHIHADTARIIANEYRIVSRRFRTLLHAISNDKVLGSTKVMKVAARYLGVR